MLSNVVYYIRLQFFVPVAQMDRASASGAEGRAFESPQARRAVEETSGLDEHIGTRMSLLQ